MGTLDYGKLSHFIKHEGVYMFGGVTGKSASEQQLINKTFFFPVGTNKPKKWIELETSGVQPESRFHHS
jgi:hypothetical protein